MRDLGIQPLKGFVYQIPPLTVQGAPLKTGRNVVRARGIKDEERGPSKPSGNDVLMNSQMLEQPCTGPAGVCSRASACMQWLPI